MATYSLAASSAYSWICRLLTCLRQTSLGWPAAAHKPPTTLSPTDVIQTPPRSMGLASEWPVLIPAYLTCSCPRPAVTSPSCLALSAATILWPRSRSALCPPPSHGQPSRSSSIPSLEHEAPPSWGPVLLTFLCHHNIPETGTEQNRKRSVLGSQSRRLGSWGMAHTWEAFLQRPAWQRASHGRERGWASSGFTSSSQKATRASMGPCCDLIQPLPLPRPHSQYQQSVNWGLVSSTWTLGGHTRPQQAGLAAGCSETG